MEPRKGNADATPQATFCSSARQWNQTALDKQIFVQVIYRSKKQIYGIDNLWRGTKIMTPLKSNVETLCHSFDRVM